MSQSRKLLKNTFVYSIGVIGTKILSFLLIPIYSYYLTKEEFGIYDTILVNISLLTPLVNLQIPQSLYRWLSEKTSSYEITKSSIISTCFFAVSGLSIVFISLYCFVAILYDFKYKLYFLIALLTLCYLMFFHCLARGLKRNDIYAKSSVLASASLVLFTFISLVILDLSVIGLLLSLILSQLSAIIYIVVTTKSYQYIKVKEFNSNLLKLMVNYSSPLIPNNISWWAINSSSRYIILLFMSLEYVGLYAIAFRFPTIIALFNTIFNVAWQDSVIQNQNSKNFNNIIYSKYFNFQLGILFPLIAFSKYLATFLLDSKFHDSWKYMGILFVAASFSGLASYYDAIYLEKRKTKTLFTTTLIGALANIIFSIVLIQYIELYGVAIAMVIGYVITFLLRMYFLRKDFLPKVNKREVFFIVLMIIAFLIFTLYSSSILLDIFIMILSLSFFYLLNKTTILSLSKFIIAKIKNRKN